MYARGMSVREIQAFLAESYGTEVSPDFISSVTDEVMAETIAWQNRPLETMYPVVFFRRAGSRSATTVVSVTKRCTWRWAYRPTVSATCWACGSSRPRGQVLAQGLQ